MIHLHDWAVPGFFVTFVVAVELMCYVNFSFKGTYVCFLIVPMVLWIWPPSRRFCCSWSLTHARLIYIDVLPLLLVHSGHVQQCSLIKNTAGCTYSGEILMSSAAWWNCCVTAPMLNVERWWCKWSVHSRKECPRLFNENQSQNQMKISQNVWLCV